MALVAHLKDYISLSAYYQQVNTLMSWINESSSELKLQNQRAVLSGGGKHLIPPALSSNPRG